MAITITLPKSGLVVLCATAGSGKSTFARKWFKPTNVVSSDCCRAMISDDETDMSVSKEAFQLLRFIADKRLALGKLTVIDSTAVTRQSRKELLKLGKKHDCHVTLIVLDIPLETCLRQNLSRERQVAHDVIRKQRELLEKSLPTIHEEGFDQVHILTEADLKDVKLEIIPLPVENPAGGPFDIIGDVHGCYRELTSLLEKLGYIKSGDSYRHPQQRKAVFLGDLADRAPNGVQVVKLVAAMTAAGDALYTPGNHCRKLARYLEGRNVQLKHGLEVTARSIAGLPDNEREAFAQTFLTLYRQAPPYLILDQGRLVVAHAGIKEDMIGKISRRIISFCLFGDVNGETTPEGLPLRRDWAADYKGKALIVYGHTPVPEPRFLNNTINIDTGCSMGGKLTAFRYPEQEIVQADALEVYYSHPHITPGQHPIAAEQPTGDILGSTY